jgi:hypothetical protein
MINADLPEELVRLIALAESGTNPSNDTSNVESLPEREEQEGPQRTTGIVAARRLVARSHDAGPSPPVDRLMYQAYGDYRG